MSVLNDLTYEVSQILKSYGKTLILYDDNGNEIYDAKNATRIYAQPENILLAFSEGSNDDVTNDIDEIKIYMSDTVEINEILKMLTSLRHTSNRFGYVLTIKQYGKKVTPKDFILGKLDESKLYGSTNDISYQDVGNIKIVVEHDKPIDPFKRGSRSRSISQIYIENLDTNERFRMKSKSLNSARAMARHVGNGGHTTDNIGMFIENIAQEYTAVKKFKSLCDKSTFDASSYKTNAIRRINEIKNTFSIIQGGRNYKKYYDMISKGIFEYNSNTAFSDIQEQFDFDVSFIEPYFLSISGGRNTEFPVIIVSDVGSLMGDIKSLTKYKNYIDFECSNLNNSISVFNPNCFAEVLHICEELGITYELETIIEDNNMNEEKYSVGYSLPTTVKRDSLLSSISDDFSYSPEEVFPVGTTKIGFADKGIFDSLKDYIETMDPYAKESNINENHIIECDDTDEDQETIEQEPVEESTIDVSPKNKTIDIEVFEDLINFVSEYNPDVFLKEAGMNIPGFGDVENAIHNSADLFNINEFKTYYDTEFMTTSEVVEAIEDYLFDKVLSENPKLASQHIEKEMFNDVANGICKRYSRSLKESSIIDVIESMDIGSLIKEYTKDEFESKLYEFVMANVQTSEISEENIMNVLNQYSGILDPIFEAYSDEMHDIRTHGLNKGQLVMTPVGKGTIIGTSLTKRKTTIVQVELQDGSVDDFADVDVVPITKKEKVMAKTKATLGTNQKISDNFGVNPDGSIRNTFEESEEEITLDQIIPEFNNDPEYGGYLVKVAQKCGGELDVDFIDDKIIDFMQREDLNASEEEIMDMRNKLIDIYTNMGFEVSNIEATEDEDVVNTDYQTSILGDIESDRIYNPHQHDFNSPVTGDQADQISRLKALAGLSRTA